jgi:hypothetical protein
MSQTALMFFALVVSFLVFVTVKGQLPTYLCIVGI